MRPRDLLIDLIRADVEGRINLPRNVLIVHSIDGGSIFTRKRMELLKTIKKDNGLTLRQLAGKLHRKEEALSRDIKLLEDRQVVSVRREGRTARPAVNVDLIMVPLTPLRHGHIAHERHVR